MRRTRRDVMLIIGSVILSLLFNGFAQEGGSGSIADRIKNYEFERYKTVGITRNIIVDYLKANQLDSVRITVAFCDSINSPDSTWLSRTERAFIHFICVDTLFLYDKKMYTETFGLVDTSVGLEKMEICFNQFQRWKYSQRSEDTQDNLSLVLFKTCTARLKEYQETYTGLADIWDLWEIVAFDACRSLESKKQNLEAFHKKYPKSALSVLSILDYKEREKQAHARSSQSALLPVRGTAGGGFMIGCAYNRIPDADNALVPNGISLALAIDVMTNNWLYQVGLDVSNARTQHDLINNDTLKKGSIVVFSKYSLSIGRPVDLGRTDLLFPIVGAVLFVNYPVDRSEVGFDLPYFVGAKAAVEYNHILSMSKDMLIGPALRVSAGMYVGNFPEIDASLRMYQFYLTVSIGFLGYAAD